MVDVLCFGDDSVTLFKRAMSGTDTTKYFADLTKDRQKELKKCARKVNLGQIKVVVCSGALPADLDRFCLLDKVATQLSTITFAFYFADASLCTDEFKEAAKEKGCETFLLAPDDETFRTTIQGYVNTAGSTGLGA